MEKLKKELYKKNTIGKIEIKGANRNRLIPMDIFLSFLTVPIKKYDGYGYNNGWTEHRNEELKLIVKGGIINDIEFLHSIQYGKNLHNIYNNYVDPFCIFAILNDEGKIFFIEYYKKEIEDILEASKNEMDRAIEDYKEICAETQKLFSVYKERQKEATT